MSNDSITLGPITLQHKDIAPLVDFYSRIIGLEILSKGENFALLGNKDREVLHLVQNKKLKQPVSDSVGLYHLALLFPTQESLARVLLKIFAEAPFLIEGTADHGVSEAFYFTDPLGNGLELYYDKPREMWPMKDGKVEFTSIFIDPQVYVNEYINGESDLSSPVLGHVHLSINDIAKAKEFYSEVLKLDIVAELGNSALFVSYDEYHHHLGMNIWESADGENLDDKIEGLKSYTINYSKKQLFENIVNNLDRKKIKYSKDKNTIMLKDPFNIPINLVGTGS